MDTGELLSVFIQHGEDIYNWTQNKENEIGRCDDLHLIDYSASYKFHRQNDRSFYYLHNNYERMENIKGISSIKVSKHDTQKLNFQEIRKVQIYNSTFKVTSTYRVLKQTEKIINFDVDHVQEKLVILSKFKQINHSRQHYYLFKIFDCKSGQVIFKCQLKNPDLVGRFSLGLFTINNGHMFWQNNVMKIRYDLTNSQNNQKYQEEDVFDFYPDIFNLNPNMKVLAFMPLDSIQSHRMGYVISDCQYERAKYIIILPYLNDKKIFLNRMKLNTHFFYTSIETTEEQERDYNDKVERQILLKLTESDNKEYHLRRFTRYLKRNILVNLMENKMKLEHSQPKNGRKFISIVCMNITEQKYYIYSQNGLLINRIEFDDYIEKYGDIIVTSPNGQNFILQKKSDKRMITLVKLTMFGMQIVSWQDNGGFSYDLINLLRKQLAEKSSQKQQNFIDELITKRDGEEIISDDIEMEFKINDELDLCIMITSENQRGFFYKNYDCSQKCVLTHSASLNALKLKLLAKNQNIQKISKEKNHSKKVSSSLRVVSKDRYDSFVMTSDQVYLYNKYCIHFHHFYDDFNSEKNQAMIDFHIVKNWEKGENTKYSEKFGQFI